MPDPADTAYDTDSPATMVIRPSRPSGGKEKAAKLSYDNLYKRALDLGYSKAGAAGIARNFMRESQGDPTAIGDQGTSRGLGQWHNSRKAALEDYAKKIGGSPDDPNVQFRFFDQEMRSKFPALRSQLVKATNPDEAEDAFKRVYERPASIMWQHSPRVYSDRYRFSDDALKAHDGIPGTDVMLMSPQDYLDLSPDFEEAPFKSQSGRSLVRSVNRGDAVDAIPTMDMRVHGPTGVVTAQDGRHRALLAQQEGLNAIPVAVRREGDSDSQPTEIQGMSGNVVPMDFPKASSMPGSIWSAVTDAVMPKAEAAENPYAKWAQPPTSQPAPTGSPDASNPYAKWAAPNTPPAAPPAAEQPTPHDGMLLSGVKGAAAGLGRTVLGSQELLGKGLQAAGVSTPGDWLVNDARSGLDKLDKTMKPDKAAHPWATGAGEVLGAGALPGSIAAKIGGNALKVGAVAGALSGLTQPGDRNHYWLDKATQTGLQGVLGAVGGVVLDKAANFIGRQIRPIYEFVQHVTGEPIAKNKGALAVVQRLERDAKVGGPTAQDMIDIANALPDKPLTLADLGGEETASYTGRLARTPGEARSKLTKFLNDRDRGAGTRLANDVDRGLGSGSSYDIADALKQARATAAKPAYEAAYRQFPVNPDEMADTGQIGKLLNRPSIRAGMANARKIAAEEGVDLAADGVDLDAEGVPHFTKVPSWRALDYIKRGLDNVVEQYRDKTTGRLVLDTYGRAADATRTEFRNALRKLNPKYAEALDLYSGPSQSLDALHAGEDFLTQRPEEIARRLASLGKGDREFYKLGAADALRTRIAKKALSADESKAVLNSDYMRQQLRPLFDSDDAYHRFISSVLAEARMFQTRFNALGGSQTAARMAEDRSPEMDALSHLAMTAAHAKSGNALRAASSGLRAVKAWLAARNPKTASEAVDLLTTPLARGDVQARTNQFNRHMTDLLANHQFARRNALANALRKVQPFAGASLGAAFGSADHHAPDHHQ